MDIVMVDLNYEKNFAFELIEYSVQILPLPFELLCKFQLGLNVITTMGASNDVKDCAFEMIEYSIKILSLPFEFSHNSQVHLTSTTTILKMNYMCQTYVIRITEQKMRMCQRIELCSTYVRTYNMCHVVKEN